MSVSPKRILLIGASKNIGFHCLEFLAPHPDKYTCFVLARTPADKVALFDGKTNVTFIQGDATDQNVVEHALYDVMRGNVDFIVCTVGSDIGYTKLGMPRMANPELW
jgi:NAD(P)-dependent dehydrogenase (short-subunit alcohol dehydrogenase family)